MKKVEGIELVRMKNKELCGFFLAIKACFIKIYDEMPEFEKAFDVAITKFRDVTEPSEKDKLTQVIDGIEAEAHQFWHDMRYTLEALSNHPAEEIRTAATQLYEAFMLVEDPRRHGYTTQYAEYIRLIKKLERIDLEARKLCLIQDWIDAFKINVKKFNQAYSERQEKSVNRETGVVKAARREACVAYRNMIEDCNAYLRIGTGDPRIEQLADFLNAAIIKKRTTIRAAKTRAANDAITADEKEKAMSSDALEVSQTVDSQP